MRMIITAKLRRLSMATAASLVTLISWGCDGTSKVMEPTQDPVSPPSLNVTPSSTPSTLEGEHPIIAGLWRQVGNCSTDDFVSFVFSFRGTAAEPDVDPYPGTFGEAGRLRLQIVTGLRPDGQQGRIGVVPSSGPFLDAVFTIVSPSKNAVVFGTKTATTGHVVSVCENGRLRFDEDPLINATYRATILTRSGRFRDEGTALIAFLVSHAPDLPNVMEEIFTTSLPAPLPIP